jgi:cathepsin A (carboxypeptidase C)
MIGNGWTDPLYQVPTYPKFARENALLDEDVIRSMEESVPRCEFLVKSCYKNPKSPFTCVPASIYCNRVIHVPYLNTGRNPYDIRKSCEGGGLCYDILDGIEAWANRDEVRAELGVDAEVKEFKSCNDNVNRRFFLGGDHSKSLADDISLMLDSGVRVLIYAGDKDWMCQWIGNKAWTLQLEWSGKTDYANAKDKTWFSWLTFEEAGEARSAGNLTFLRVFDSGHMVPYDQPLNSLDFVLKWLRGVPLGSKEPPRWGGKKP